MKTKFVLLCLILALAGPVSARRSFEGSYARSLQQVLRLRPEQIDLGRAALLISRQRKQELNINRYSGDLETMVEHVAHQIEKQGLVGQPAAVNVLNEYLFAELGFSPIEEPDNPEDLFLHSVMDTGRGYCLSLSILYLAIGQRLDMPLYGVVVPSHFFVRYDDGQQRFNIETTLDGGIVDDEYYLEQFQMPDDIGDSIYMQNLDNRQSLGCFLNNLGNVYFEDGNLEQARVALERAVNINPSLAEARMNLGNIYLGLDMISRAIGQYEAAIRYNPGDAKVYSNLANAHMRQKNWQRAAGLYRRSIELDADFTEAYRNLASAYMLGDMHYDAIEQLHLAISISPDEPDSHIQLGDAYSAIGRYQRAIEAYKQALSLDSGLAQAWYGLGICYFELDMTAPAKEAYQQSLEIKPDMAGALVNLGNIHFNQDDYRRARRYYHRALQAAPEQAVIAANIGGSYLNEQNYAQAAQAYAQAMEIDPNLAEAHRGMAVALYYLDDIDRAYYHLQLALELGAQVQTELRQAIESRR